MTFTFAAAVAWDSSGNKPVKNASFQVYAVADTAYTTPLAITDPFNNPIPGNILNSGPQGVFPQFNQATNSAVVITDPAHTYAWTINAVMQDASVAAYINASGSATQSALAGAYAGKSDVIPKWKPSTAYLAGDRVVAPTGDTVTAIASFTSGSTFDATNWNSATIRDQAPLHTSPGGLQMYSSAILSVGTAGQFDAGYIESPCIFLDPATGKYVMTYTGWSGPGQGGVGSIGYATSDDLVTWTKQGQFFTASGTAGAPDQMGVTGSNVFVLNSNYYHFYIGLTGSGYEAGNKSICLATATSLSGPWTRMGAVILPSGAANSWRKTAVWHPNIFYAKGTWYMFFNATGDNATYTAIERMGYATAPAITGPWTVQDANCPLLPEAGHAADKIWGGDPFIYVDGNQVTAVFANADSSFNPIGDWTATTTLDKFPLGWTVGKKVTDYTSPALQPFKPWIVRANGQTYHYGVNNGYIDLMVSSDASNRNTVATGRWRFNGIQGTGQDSTLMVGDDIRSATATGRAKLQIGKSNANSELLIGQDGSHSLVVNWNYNATAGNATAGVGTYGGSNRLDIQTSGPLGLSGSGGQLGFYGTTPIARQTGTPVAATDLASALTLVNDLRAKLLALGIIA